MKKTLTIVTTLAVLGAAVPRAHAHGDKGLAIAGGVLAGIGTGILISKAFEPAPVYVAPAPVVVQQPATVVYQPAPTQQVVVQQPVQQVINQPVVVQQPVVVAPAPVVYPAPVYVRPAPVVGFGFSFGRPYPYHHYHYRHW